MIDQRVKFRNNGGGDSPEVVKPASREIISVNPMIMNGVAQAKKLITESYAPSDELELIKENEEAQLEVNGLKFDVSNDHSDRFGWVQNGDDVSLTVKPNIDNLTPDYYTIKTTYSGWYLQKKHLYLDELYKLPNEFIDDIFADITKFWNNRASYDKYSITYKRGYLMHGLPGTGKTSLINFMIHEFVNKYNGIVFDYHSQVIDIVRQVRLCEPDRPIMLIMEELEELVSYEGQRLLQLLDGTTQIDNVCYIATTNYLDRLPSRIYNRPSRFDKVYHIDLPDAAARKFFITQKLFDDDLAKIDIDRWVRDTDGLSMAHLKELIVCVIVNGREYDDTINYLKKINSLDVNNLGYHS